MPRRPPRAPGTLQATVGEKTKKPNHIVIDISISIVIIICSGIQTCFVSPPLGPRLSGTQTLSLSLSGFYLLTSFTSPCSCHFYASRVFL